MSDFPFATMAFWFRLLWIARMIWACRVSVLSAIAGFWLFWKVPQAQDLFADISYAVFLLKKDQFNAVLKTGNTKRFTLLTTLATARLPRS